MTHCTYYDSGDLEITFVCEYDRYDELERQSVDVLQIKILSVPVSFTSLPKEVQKAILDLHRETI
jgi:hypothetical protein